MPIRSSSACLWSRLFFSRSAADRARKEHDFFDQVEQLRQPHLRCGTDHDRRRDNDPLAKADCRIARSRRTAVHTGTADSSVDNRHGRDTGRHPVEGCEVVVGVTSAPEVKTGGASQMSRSVCSGSPR